MTKNKILILPLLALTLMTSCSRTPDSTPASSLVSTSGTTTDASSSSAEQSSFHTVKEALNYLNREEARYSLKTYINKRAARPNLIFTADYTWMQDDDDYQSGYVKTAAGVASYSIESDENKKDYVLAGEVLKSGADPITSLYDNSTVVSLFDVDFSSLKDGTEVSTSKRNVCTKVMNLIDLSDSSYLFLKDVMDFKLDTATQTLTISFTLSDTNAAYQLVLTDFYTARVDLLDSFVAEGGTPFTPTAEETKVRDLFAADNYLREEPLSDGSTGVLEYFTDQYYFNYASSKYISTYPELVQYANRGYIHISKPEAINIEGTSGPLIYDDVFLTYTDSQQKIKLITQENSEKPGYARGAFTTKQDDVSAVMNYPKNLLLFKRMQYLTYADGVYSTDDYDIGVDFFKNFGITSSDDLTMGWSTIDMKIEGDIDSSEVKVTFTANVFNAETHAPLSPYVFTFTNFGTTAFKPMEDFIEKYSLR